MPADAEGFADNFARTVDGGGIDDRHGVGDGALARELHRDRTEGGRKVDVVDDGAERLEKRCIDGSLVVGENGAHLLEDRLHHQAVHGLPAVEGIAVGAGKQRKRVGVEADVEDDRRGKAAVEARNGFFAKAREDPGLACVLELEHARELGGAFGLAFEQNGHLAALGVEQRDGEGHEHRFLGGLARRGRRGLLDRHDELARLGVPLRGDGDARGACLRVPAAELLEVATRGLLHGFEEGLARHGVAVVAGDVEVETLAEGVLAQKRLEHADDFGALFIHGARVEVVDLLIAVGTDRVGHGACVLGELGQT